MPASLHETRSPLIDWGSKRHREINRDVRCGKWDATRLFFLNGERVRILQRPALAEQLNARHGEIH